MPRVEHDVPLDGIAIAPVTIGAGLTPGDAISVAPRGMPVGATDEPVVMPSGDVAAMVGVGLTIPLTCAMAALHTTNAGSSETINATLTCILRSFDNLVRGKWMACSERSTKYEFIIADCCFGFPSGAALCVLRGDLGS